MIDRGNGSRDQMYDQSVLCYMKFTYVYFRIYGGESDAACFQK